MAEILLSAHPYGTLVALLVASLCVLEEYLKHRQLKKFGDGEILGIERRRFQKAAGIVLMALGMAALVSIVFPSRPLESGSAPIPLETRVILDTASLAPSGSSGSNQWDLTEALLAAIPAEAEKHRLALYLWTSAPDLVIPSTADLTGYRILLKRLRIERSATVEPGPGAALAGLERFLAPENEDMVLLLTGRDMEAVGSHLAAATVSPGRIAIAHLPKEGSVIRYRFRSSGGAWVQGEGIGELAALVAEPAEDEENAAGLFGRNAVIRSWALAALFLLLTEFLLAGFWPNRAREESGA